MLKFFFMILNGQQISQQYDFSNTISFHIAAKPKFGSLQSLYNGGDGWWMIFWVTLKSTFFMNYVIKLEVCPDMLSFPGLI